jgi:hypothetical protein
MIGSQAKQFAVSMLAALTPLAAMRPIMAAKLDTL